MRKIFSLLLAVLWVQQLWAQYNPDNPADPDVYYALTLKASPSAGGSVSPASQLQVAEGMTVTCKAIANSGYHFVEWTDGSLVVSTEPTFDYVMPANNVTLTAVFEWLPDNPGDPDNEGYSHKIYLEASPAHGGYFDNSTLLVVEGKTAEIKAYPYDGYKFSAWKKDGEIVSTVNPMTVTMGTDDVTYTASFVYAPDNPGDPDFKEPYAVLSEGNTKLTFFYDDKKESRGGMSVGPFSASNDGNRVNVNSGWDLQRENIQTVVFDESFVGCTSITNTAYWFYGFKNLTTIDGINYLKTDNVTDMSHMFWGCSGLTSLELNFDTSNVTNMQSMFAGCHNLTNLDVSSLNTDHVTDMSNMFAACHNLANLDVNHFNTANVTDMSYMFSNCYSLTSLDISHFETSKVVNLSAMFDTCSGLTELDLSHFNTSNAIMMSIMFAYCSGLTTIYVGEDWTTTNVTESADMFTGCTNLVGGNGTPYSADHIDQEYACIDKPNEPGYFTDKNASATPEPYAVLSNDYKTLTFYYDDKKEANGGMSVGPFSSSADRGWRGQSESIKTVVFDSSFADYTNLTSTAYWFSGCLNLAAITGLGNLKTNNVTDMRSMFEACKSLTSLDLSSFNTEKVTNMSDMFRMCDGMTNVNLSSFNTSNVKNMSSMFCYCSALKTLDVSKFNTEQVTTMGAMFAGCTSLTTLNVSNFNTSNVTSMNTMFSGCSGLTSLDVSNFNTEKVYDMNRMFSGCSKLTSLDLSKFNTSNVIIMTQMFSNCESLTSLDVSNFNTEKVSQMTAMFWKCSSLPTLNVSSFNTSKLTDMIQMFGYCESLTSLDLSNFNTDNVTNTRQMFYSCRSLTTINLSNFNTDNVTDMNNMFRSCASLTTLDLSSFNTGKVTDMSGLFAGCSSLASIQLGNAKVPSEQFVDIDNPNLLVYVNSADLAPGNIQNVVVNGEADKIVLTDTWLGNNNFYCPKAFTAHKISYSHSYTMHTEVGVSRGWETIALPFTVQTISHEINGALAPFGATGGKPFWLRRLTGSGLVNATTIEANVPYVISMPNNPDAYPAEYILAGRVTFSAQEVEVPVTSPVVLENGNIRMVPAFSRRDVSPLVYAINLNEARGSYAEGSVFENSYRKVWPFEAYTLHIGTGPAPQYIPINYWSGDQASGITLVMSDAEQTLKGCYTLDGRKLQDVPTTKGVYIVNGKKRVIIGQ